MSYCLFQSCPEYTDPTVDSLYIFRLKGGSIGLSEVQKHLRTKRGSFDIIFQDIEILISDTTSIYAELFWF